MANKKPQNYNAFMDNPPPEQHEIYVFYVQNTNYIYIERTMIVCTRVMFTPRKRFKKFYFHPLAGAAFRH